MIPAFQTRALTEAAANAEFIAVPGGVHNAIARKQLQRLFSELNASLRSHPAAETKAHAL